jgi:hypothetical protein
MGERLEVNDVQTRTVTQVRRKHDEIVTEPRG